MNLRKFGLPLWRLQACTERVELRLFLGSKPGVRWDPVVVLRPVSDLTHSTWIRLPYLAGKKALSKTGEHGGAIVVFAVQRPVEPVRQSVTVNGQRIY